jgi:mono/diheme cytochrome c family protein
MKHSVLIAGTMAGGLLAGIWLGPVVDPPLTAAQDAKGLPAPPFDLSDRSAIDEGARLFRQSCTGYCHGKEGGAARAPKLRGQKLDQRHVYARIAKGSPNGMPGFEGALSQENIWKLVAYVLSLSERTD